MTHVAVIGGGIIGLATIKALSQAAPEWKLTLIEKEPGLAAHQSGRNSGVIHSGIYYRPGSLKARYCRSGVELLKRFCRQQSVDYERRGKLISASNEQQQKELAGLLERGKQNGIECRRLTAKEAKSMEPRLVSCGAIEVPSTGIVDYAEVTRALAGVAEEAGVDISTSTELLDIRQQDESISLETTKGSLTVDGYLNCAGLHSDRLARLAGLSLSAKIIPFRGEYYRLQAGAAADFNGRLIYPVPDPRFPFLGVHLTPTLDGEYLFGPNAVLALAREGYGWDRISLSYLAGLLTYPGFLRLAGKNWRFGLVEIWRSFSRKRFAASVGELVEGVRQQDLVRARSGVRAQLVSTSGQLVDDFSIEASERGLHLLNAPSPAATASLAIGGELAQRALDTFSNKDH